MKIYDCFTFFNELDILEERFKLLDNHVDYFVLVEARQTHSGINKPLYFRDNIKRFKKWEDKIIHIVVNLPKISSFEERLVKMSKNGNKLVSKLLTTLGLGYWRRERYQRKMIKRGLVDCKDYDIILVSDVDEFPDINGILFAKRIIERYMGSLGIIGFRQKLFQFNKDNFIGKTAVCTTCCTFKYLKDNLKGNPQLMRIPSFKHRMINKFVKHNETNNNWYKRYFLIHNGGDHYSSFGNQKEKLNAYAHSERSKRK